MHLVLKFRIEPTRAGQTTHSFRDITSSHGSVTSPRPGIFFPPTHPQLRWNIHCSHSGGRSQRICGHTRDPTRSPMRTHAQFRMTPAHTVFRGGMFRLQITLGRIFHQQAFLLTLFPPLTATTALLSTFELGVPKAFVTTFLSFIALLTLSSQSLTDGTLLLLLLLVVVVVVVVVVFVCLFATTLQRNGWQRNICGPQRVPTFTPPPPGRNPDLGLWLWLNGVLLWPAIPFNTSVCACPHLSPVLGVDEI